MLQIKHEKEEMDHSYKERLCANYTTTKENDSLIKQLVGSVDEYKARLICTDPRLQLYSCSVEREKTLGEQELQVEASLAATECQLIEAKKKQYDLMLESKQIALSRHLVQLSLKNDQAINEIHKKYEQQKI